MEPASVTQSRLMGALLVEHAMITEEQLEQALARQDESGERLGEILVAEFGVSRLQLAGVLAEQWTGGEKDGGKPALELVEPLTPAEVRIRRPLGELLVERGLVTAAQLKAVLDLQRKTGTRIGEILVEQGLITLSDLSRRSGGTGVPAGGCSHRRTTAVAEHRADAVGSGSGLVGRRPRGRRRPRGTTSGGGANCGWDAVAGGSPSRRL